ncbi:MAG TPA: sialidase family protein [Thermoguttaceae bacterium]|nr:sialidase family protein [Thermoguttaceae bacterium]
MRDERRLHVGLAVVAAVLFAAASRADEKIEQIDVFTGGTGGYHTYRIPAVVLTNQGTLLAFCEGRKTGGGDHGDLDLVLRRSADGGKTWEPMQLVYEEGGTAKITIGNPCPVVDRSTGTVWLPFCRDNDRVLITHSTDDGKSWAEPVEITADVKKPEWGWYATGPGHGIQLAGGRLVIPCDCGETKGWGQWDKKGRSLVFYSDDHGKSWKLGGATDLGMNECEVVERADGSLLLSMRNYFGKNQRAFAASTDAGSTWSAPQHHEQVYCPTCQSSIQRYSLEPKNIILYSGPGGPGRSHMTVRLSYDEGKTWPVAKVIYEGSAAYSDLVVLSDGTIGCLYERDGYGKITFARFSLDWLTSED